MDDKSITGLLILIRKFYCERAIDEEQKTILKAGVLDREPILLEAFDRFVIDNDKDGLVQALISVIKKRTVPSSVRFLGALLDAYQLNATDAELLKHTVVKTGFNSITVRDLWHAFEREAYYEGLTYDKFLRCIRYFTDNYDDPEYLKDFFCRLFNMFDQDHHGVVDFGQFLAGLSTLCHGTPHEKLEFAFRVLDSNVEGEVSDDDLYEYCLAFAAVLGVLTNKDGYEFSHKRTIQQGTRICEDFWTDRTAKTINFTDILDWNTSPPILFDLLFGA